MMLDGLEKMMYRWKVKAIVPQDGFRIPAFHEEGSTRMTRVFFIFTLLSAASVVFGSEPEQRLAAVTKTKGLIAFWDFASQKDGRWTSFCDNDMVTREYPVVLRRIGDPKSYTPDQWPYTDERSKLVYDSTGPFGHAVRFNQGYVFAEVPRSQFDRSPLDIHGRRPFTLIAWTKFVGHRHLVAGIWDEGGWNKYGGRRQIALFGGLFGSQGIIGHISATGASSYPQSTIGGSQYARCRAIDGRDFKNGQWVSMAMTFDPTSDEVTVYCDGVATATHVTDPVAKDVFQYQKPVASNPFHFPWPIYSPRSFALKFNGYNVQSSGVYEHWLHVDTEKGTVAYGRSCPDAAQDEEVYRVEFDVQRDGGSLLPEPLVFNVLDSDTAKIPEDVKMQPGDEIITSLHVHKDGDWKRIGTEIRYRLREGAPFTFGRALGLGTEPIDHGTQLFLDGVAVFNRVLDQKELQDLSFPRR